MKCISCGRRLIWVRQTYKGKPIGPVCAREVFEWQPRERQNIKYVKTTKHIKPLDGQMGLFVGVVA